MVTNANELSSMISLSSIIITVIVCLLVIVINFWGLRRLQLRKKTFKIPTRIAGVIITTLMIFSFFRINHTNGIVAKTFAKLGIQSYTWSLEDSANNNGPVIAFINSIDITVMDEPAGYSQARMQTIAKRYQKVANTINQHRTQSNINKQTLIYILSESFSDPTRVPNLKVSADPIPKIRKIKQTTTSGVMLSSGYGGGTANMEYMVDTSLTLNFFSKTLTTPFTQLVPNQKKAYAITDLFNTKNAIHTNTGTFYRRIDVYKKFGFQTFRNTDSKGKLKLHYTKKIQNSEYIGDDASYNNALWQVKQKQGGQFISLATMQNHMPFTNKYYHNDYTITGVAGKYNNAEITNYTEGLHLTDNSTKAFIDKLDKMKKPITVLWYGDHLASLYNGDSMATYNVQLHEPDYFIYSNKYARQHGYGTKKIKANANVVGSNALSALVLEQMHQKVSPYYALITKVLKELPAMASDSQNSTDALLVNQNNQQTYLRNLTASQRKIYEDYKLVQYDLTAGKSYLGRNNFMTLN
ncbi:LTA synthase family protein [Lactiplantibacillus fabifermentans]|nr:LTA synthase family protein [Lactiplantibacillus fabifermentans]